MNHICISALKNCKNPLESYGEICVHCNKCHRYDVHCLICGKLLNNMPESNIITVEFYDSFCEYICKSHEHLFKNFGKYGDKYETNMRKNEFVKKMNK